MKKLKMYMNLIKLLWRVFWSFDECNEFLKRPNKLSNRRQKHILVPVEKKLMNERKTGKLVNRQDMLSYLLATAMQSSENAEDIKEEYTDIITLLAACICEPTIIEEE